LDKILKRLMEMLSVSIEAALKDYLETWRIFLKEISANTKNIWDDKLVPVSQQITKFFLIK
jgi:hypothetical protein